MEKYRVDFYYADGRRECSFTGERQVLQSLKDRLMHRYADNDGSIERIIERTSKRNETRTVSVVNTDGTYAVYTLPYKG